MENERKKMKKIFFYGLIVFLILIMISGVFGYKRLCLKKGEYVPPDDPRYVCEYTQCIICVTDNYYPTHPGRCNDIEGCESLGDPIDPVDLAIIVESPDNTVYSDDKVLFDVDLSKPADLYYILDDEEKKLCSSCSSYKREKSLDDGNYEITFKAVSGGEIVQDDVSFVVDSDEPKIRNTEPKKGFANGEFLIEYDEENLEGISLFYNGNEEILQCESGKKKQCVANVNLEGYDEVTYYFVVSDSFNAVTSKSYTLDVDMEEPVFEEFDYLVDGRYVYLNIKVSEEVNLEYNDGGRWRTLKTRTDNYNGKKSFKKGYHEVIVRGIDGAGNIVSETFNFVIQ